MWGIRQWLDIRDSTQVCRGGWVIFRVSLRDTQKDLGGETLTAQRSGAARSGHVHEEGLCDIQVWWPHGFPVGHQVNNTSYYTAVVSPYIQGSSGVFPKDLRNSSCPSIQAGNTMPQVCIFIYTNVCILKKKNLWNAFLRQTKNISKGRIIVWCG